MAQAELPVLEAGLLGEVLVEELAGRHGVRGVDGVGGGEVVVLTGVDDDAGAGVDLAAEPLVDEGADRVDVAEEDAVHRVVEHHVEPLEAGQDGHLGHAEARGVVGQPDVAAQLLAGLVERGPHEPEVLLGGVGAGEPLAGGTLGDEVEQGLPGGPDHGDDVGAGPRGGLRLRDVLVDVAGRDDEVDPGRAGRVAEPVDQPLRARAGGRRWRGCRRARPCASRPGRGVASRPSGTSKRTSPVAARAASSWRSLASSRRRASQTGSGDAVLEPDVGADGVDQPVGPRRALGVGAGQPGQPQRGALDRHGGVLLGELDDGLAHLARELAGLLDGPLVELELADGLGHQDPSSGCGQAALEELPDGRVGAQQVQGVRRVAGRVAVADQHRHVGGQTLGPERRGGERRRHREEDDRAALGGGQDRAALAAGHVDADHGDVGRARRRRRRRRAARSGRARRR